MPVKRLRRTTLDDFISAAREAAAQARSAGVDVETMLARLADLVAEKSYSRIEVALRERCGGQGELRDVVRDAVRDAVKETVVPLIAGLERRITSLEEKIDSLLATMKQLQHSGLHGGVASVSDRLPGWAKRIARKLEAAPYVRLHEESIDVYNVKSSLDVLQKLNAVLVETPAGVYLVKREEWMKLLDALASIRSRDEEAALRRAGPLAEIVAALLRSNMLYYNNGWRVLRDAYLDPYAQ